MNITVFGAASPKPGEKDYEDALWLGCEFAKAGHVVLNGGYIGTMEAVSRGATKVGGKVIGVTCVEIEDWRKIGPNPWLTEVHRCQTLRERLWELVNNCDAAIALPGGPGTLAEVGFLWNHVAIEAIPQKPLIMVGHAWRKVMDTFFAEMGAYIREKDQGWVKFVPTVSEAVSALK